MLVLAGSQCHITLLQPKVKRPAQSFVNPTKRLVYSVNDGMAFAAIAMLATGRMPTQEYHEASHLCGMPRCVNVDHLVWEDLATNAARNLCHHYNVPCTHQPPCIHVTHADKALLTKYLRTK